MSNEIKTTGQMRTMLVNATKGVLNGDLDIEKANAIHMLSKNITDSLYSENKIAMFNRECKTEIYKIGQLPIGDE